MSEATVVPFPTFRYIDTMSYEDNYYRWKNMLDDEYKWGNEPYMSDTEGRSLFRKQWGYKYFQKYGRGVHTHTVNYYKGSIS